MPVAAPNLRLRLIVDSASAGPWNMSVDEALLEDAIENGTATLRFYEWSEPTLSLGYFQRYDERHQHVASRNAAIVRRQSGGGAILHDRELTYSLALPAAHPLALQADKLYTVVHEAVITVLARHVAAVSDKWSMRLRCNQCGELPANEPFLCFQRRAAGDVVLVQAPANQSPDGNSPDSKILGSAQRRRRGAILQHGSLLLSRSPAAPELPGMNDLTGTALTPSDLVAELPGRLSAALEVQLEESNLPDDQRKLAAELISRKYATEAWTNRR